jgi:hypothetical protein
MSVRTNPDQRREFYRLHLQGETYPAIAEQFDVSKECVRYWCRRQWKGKGYETTYWRDPSGALGHFHPLVRYAILRLRLEHPRWGPNRIREKLKKRASVRGLRLPSEASMGRCLHQWARFRRRPSQKPDRWRPDQPTAVHQRWQMDFKMAIHLQDGSQVNLHTVCDPVGEACLGAFVFPAQPTACRTQRVPFEQVRSVLRSCFALWNTLPDQIQTDGEPTLVVPARIAFLPPSPYGSPDWGLSTG